MLLLRQNIDAVESLRVGCDAIDVRRGGGCGGYYAANRNKHSQQIGRGEDTVRFKCGHLYHNRAGPRKQHNLMKMRTCEPTSSKCHLTATRSRAVYSPTRRMKGSHQRCAILCLLLLAAALNSVALPFELLSARHPSQDPPAGGSGDSYGPI